MNQSKKGYTLIELVLVLFLLVLVASLVFSLTAAGSEAWLRLSSAREERSDLRTAMSYIEVQLRKADMADGISIEADPFNGESALYLVKRIKNPTIPDNDQTITWIYLEDNTLYEFVTMPGMETIFTQGRPLLDNINWELNIVSDHMIEIKLWSDIAGNNQKELVSRQIYIRSGGLLK